MTDMGGQKYSLVFAFLTKWTTTWLSFCSVLRARRALHALYTIHERDIRNVSSQKGREKLRSLFHIPRQVFLGSTIFVSTNCHIYYRDHFSIAEVVPVRWLTCYTYMGDALRCSIFTNKEL